MSLAWIGLYRGPLDLLRVEADGWRFAFPRGAEVRVADDLKRELERQGVPVEWSRAPAEPA